MLMTQKKSKDCKKKNSFIFEKRAALPADLDKIFVMIFFGEPDETDAHTRLQN